MTLLSESLDIFITYRQLYFQGALNTLLLSLTGTFTGLILGLLLAGVRQIRIQPSDTFFVSMSKRVLKWIVGFYIEFVRGTPMIAQAVFVYYGLRPILGWTPMVAGYIIVSFNTAAYLAEIIRSGIQSIDVGQSHAGLAIGMTQSQTFSNIILPQAIRNSFPSIGNEFIVNIKDTSMLNAIMVTELFFQGMSVAGATYNYAASMLVIIIIYFILTFSLSRLLMVIERRLRVNSQEAI